MKIETILRKKDPRTITIRMTETAEAAARLLRRENIGAVVVKDTCGTEGDTILGMLSERDILRAIADLGVAALKMPVSALMTRDVVICDPRDEVSTVIGLMDQHHIRHVPVVQDDSLIGVISVRDLLAVPVAA
jgi:CBS domain-containing protein